MLNFLKRISSVNIGSNSSTTQQKSRDSDSESLKSEDSDTDTTSSHRNESIEGSSASALSTVNECDEANEKISELGLHDSKPNFSKQLFDFVVINRQGEFDSYTALDYDEHLKLLAAGTCTGQIYLFGSFAIKHRLTTLNNSDESRRKQILQGIVQLKFCSVNGTLVSIDRRDRIEVQDLSSLCSIHCMEIDDNLLSFCIEPVIQQYLFYITDSNEIGVFDTVRGHLCLYRINLARDLNLEFDRDMDPNYTKLSISPNGLTLLVASYTKLVTWNILDRKVERHWNVDTELGRDKHLEGLYISAIDQSLNGKHFVTGHQNGDILVQKNSDKPHCTILSVTGTVTSEERYPIKHLRLTKFEESKELVLIVDGGTLKQSLEGSYTGGVFLTSHSSSEDAHSLKLSRISFPPLIPSQISQIKEFTDEEKEKISLCDFAITSAIFNHSSHKTCIEDLCSIVVYDRFLRVYCPKIFEKKSKVEDSTLTSMLIEIEPNFSFCTSIQFFNDSDLVSKLLEDLRSFSQANDETYGSSLGRLKRFDEAEKQPLKFGSFKYNIDSSEKFHLNQSLLITLHSELNLCRFWDCSSKNFGFELIKTFKLETRNFRRIKANITVFKFDIAKRLFALGYSNGEIVLLDLNFTNNDCRLELHQRISSNIHKSLIENIEICSQFNRMIVTDQFGNLSLLTLDKGKIIRFWNETRLLNSEEKAKNVFSQKNGVSEFQSSKNLQTSSIQQIYVEPSGYLFSRYSEEKKFCEYSFTILGAYHEVASSKLQYIAEICKLNFDEKNEIERFVRMKTYDDFKKFDVDQKKRFSDHNFEDKHMPVFPSSVLYGSTSQTTIFERIESFSKYFQNFFDEFIEKEEFAKCFSEFFELPSHFFDNFHSVENAVPPNIKHIQPNFRIQTDKSQIEHILKLSNKIDSDDVSEIKSDINNAEGGSDKDEHNSEHENFAHSVDNKEGFKSENFDFEKDKLAKIDSPLFYIGFSDGQFLTYSLENGVQRSFNFVDDQSSELKPEPIVLIQTLDGNGRPINSDKTRTECELGKGQNNFERYLLICYENQMHLIDYPCYSLDKQLKTLIRQKMNFRTIFASIINLKYLLMDFNLEEDKNNNFAIVLIDSHSNLSIYSLLGLTKLTKSLRVEEFRNAQVITISQEGRLIILMRDSTIIQCVLSKKLHNSFPEIDIQIERHKKKHPYKIQRELFYNKSKKILNKYEKLFSHARNTDEENDINTSAYNENSSNLPRKTSSTFGRMLSASYSSSRSSTRNSLFGNRNHSKSKDNVHVLDPNKDSAFQSMVSQAAQNVEKLEEVDESAEQMKTSAMKFKMAAEKLRQKAAANKKKGFQK